VEFYARLTGLPYTKKQQIDPRKGPRGKIPFLVYKGGDPLGDSSDIVQFFKDMGEEGEHDLDKDLSDEDKAMGQLLKLACEQSIYWGIVYSAFQDDSGWEVTKAEVCFVLCFSCFSCSSFCFLFFGVLSLRFL